MATRQYYATIDLHIEDQMATGSRMEPAAASKGKGRKRERGERSAAEHSYRLRYLQDMSGDEQWLVDSYRRGSFWTAMLAARAKRHPVAAPRFVFITEQVT